MRNRLQILTIIGLCLCLSCATIISGTSQPVDFESVPSGATVTIQTSAGVDTGLSGTTPCQLEIKRKGDLVCVFELEGYEEKTLLITKDVNMVVLWNLLLGGIIGLAIDYTSGAINKISPTFYKAELEQ